jgi:hypothetical protein
MPTGTAIGAFKEHSLDHGRLVNFPDPDVVVKVDYTISGNQSLVVAAPRIQRGPGLVVLAVLLGGVNVTNSIAAGLIFAMATCPFAQERTVTVRITADGSGSRRTKSRFIAADGQFLLESDDTDHGFRIIGTDVDQVIEARARLDHGEVHARQGGPCAFECSKLCGAGRLHARRPGGRGLMPRATIVAFAALMTAWTLALFTAGG